LTAEDLKDLGVGRHRRKLLDAIGQKDFTEFEDAT
jgi:hypothetical protein